MTIEGSIAGVVDVLANARRSETITFGSKLTESLRAFAAAISAKASEVQGEKPKEVPDLCAFCKGECYSGYPNDASKKHVIRQQPTTDSKCYCGESEIVHRTDGPCYHIEKQPTPELPKHHEFDGKLCDTYTASGCHCLPKKVQEKIKEVMEGTFIYGESLSKIDRGLRYGSGFGKMLESLAHLCLSMRAK